MSYPIYSAPHLTLTVQARTHKNKRINKKWRKRYGYKQIPDPNVYEINGSLYAHPATVGRILDELEVLKRNGRYDAQRGIRDSEKC